MKLSEFRITDFRSIKDTDWCSFSHDAITVLIGQNESGKTSILAALETVFSGVATINEDDIRADANLPTISIRVETTFDEIADNFAEHTEEQLETLKKYLSKVKGRLEYCSKWAPNPKGSATPFAEIKTINDQNLSEILAKSWTPPTEAPPEDAGDEENAEEETTDGDDALETTAPIELTNSAVAEAVFQAAPLTILFDEKTGLLPNSIDVSAKDGDHVLMGEGQSAAKNYLEIAGIDLAALVEGTPRLRETMLHRGNQKVTSDFAKFWSQTIGKKDKLYLKCDLKFYGASTPAKLGKPYLVFWISDGQNHLYPKQRSTGVRWFLSFYLQLKASDELDAGTFFLLDEPGANLHSKAQTDVLNLINKLNDEKKLIMYSTHSPHMIEYDKLYRVLAVQREGESDDTPTVVIHAHRLGGASRDTLSPILTAMGSDFSQQEVIRKRNNVILEEISGFYYLKSFWKLTNEKTEAHFIAATGANNVEGLANMFVGWGLDFIVAVDDDPTGRSVFNSIKRNMFGDEQTAANAHLLKINGRGIEDIFDQADFKTLVLEDAGIVYSCDNSQFVKDGQFSKALLAYQFWMKVSNGQIKMKKLSAETQCNIAELIEAIRSRLNSHVESQRT
jgi:energy-coupling factor transporter ATP-binding protein EcfA2